MNKVFSHIAQLVKNLPAMWETWVRFMTWEDPLEKGMAIHSSILAWRIPWTVGAWQSTVHGVTRVRHDLRLSFFLMSKDPKRSFQCFWALFGYRALHICCLQWVMLNICGNILVKPQFPPSCLSHPSTNQARPCLASEIRWDWARSGWYGHRPSCLSYSEKYSSGLSSGLKSQSSSL